METNHLSLTGRLWKWPEMSPKTVPHPGAGGVDTPLPPWMDGLLESRGVVGEEALEAFLSPSLRQLEDPIQMADMPKAVERLHEALTAGEAITVYGDYDVDGVCSTSILVDFLRQVGGHVEFYIPDRRAEGYGLNLDAVRQIAQTSQVLITTDCGITALDEVTAARDAGLDVIIVDHHQVPDTLPPAVACLNPHRPDCEYPFKGLCAAGVAFMVVVALRRHLREAGYFAGRKEPDVRDLLDILAVATVADMVPIEGTNRVLVSAGLKQLARTQRLGMAALMDVSEIHRSRITASDLGFRIGPRINARGRLNHAGEAVELMLTSDAERARTLAKSLDESNRERRTIEKDTVDAALAKIEAEGLGNDAGLVVYDPNWHPGVLGLVASRLTSKFHRPAVVIGDGGKGSGRSVGGFNLHDAIAESSDLLEKFGGHPAAAGLTICEENVEAFRRAFSAAAERERGAPPYVAIVEPEVEVPAPELSMDLVGQIERLGPFGQKNPEPLLVSKSMQVRNARVVGKNHLKLTLGNGVDAIAFGLGELSDRLPSHVDVVYRLERNIFRGRENMQMRVEDLGDSSQG